ncbi:MAG: glycosyltransferase family 4 protein [Saprospiraceae bacterium]
MKILYVCKSLPHNFQGGIQTHVWKLSEWMVLLGHEVSILTAGSLAKGERKSVMGGRTIIELPYFPGRRLPFWSEAAEELSFNVAARLWLLKNQSSYDIIHLQGRSGNLFLLDKALLKTPVVTTFHGLIEIEKKFTTNKKGQAIGGWLYKKMATRFENMALKNSDAVIAVSDEMARVVQVREEGSSRKTTKIYNGIDVPETTAPQNTSANTLLFVGRLTKIKGVFELVEAMKALPDFVQLVMVGDGEDRPALEKKIQEYQLGERITLTGGLPAEKVTDWINRCQALILPSYYETQGIVLMEANALEKPVIASAVGGVPEVVRDKVNGLLMPSNDPKEIVSAVSYLLAQPTLAHKMGQWGKLLMRMKFSWDNIAYETLCVYKSLLAEIPATSAPKKRLAQPASPFLTA